MPWMAELEENKRAAALAAGEDPKTPSTGTPADTQPNTPIPGKRTPLNVTVGKIPSIILGVFRSGTFPCRLLLSDLYHSTWAEYNRIGYNNIVDYFVRRFVEIG